MKRNISTMQFVIALCIVVAVIAAGATWMFRKPAAAESGGPPVGTPEASAAVKQRGREKSEEMRAEHGRGRQQPGGQGSQSTSPP